MSISRLILWRYSWWIREKPSAERSHWSHMADGILPVSGLVHVGHLAHVDALELRIEDTADKLGRAVPRDGEDGRFGLHRLGYLPQLIDPAQYGHAQAAVVTRRVVVEKTFDRVRRKGGIEERADRLAALPAADDEGGDLSDGA